MPRYYRKPILKVLKHNVKKVFSGLFINFQLKVQMQVYPEALGKTNFTRAVHSITIFAFYLRGNDFFFPPYIGKKSYLVYEFFFFF